MEYSLRRYVPLFIAGAALLVAGCGDSTAPTRLSNASAIPTLSALGGGPRSSSARANHEAYNAAATIRFTISSEGGRAQVGRFTLTYPAHSVCDPATSGYGAGVWTNACATLSEPITITARFWMEDGRTHADFSPDIRFDPSKNVTLTAIVPEIRRQKITDEIRAQYAIWYSTVVGDTRYFIDEAALYPELATVFTERHGMASGNLIRRIYHFSGYYVRSGRCDESGDGCGGGEPELLQ